MGRGRTLATPARPSAGKVLAVGLLLLLLLLCLLLLLLLLLIIIVKSVCGRKKAFS